MNINAFISFLIENGLISKDISGENEKAFENRLKIQKYVLIANRLGAGFNYDYDIYIHGPYSTKLADDYYNYARKSIIEKDDIPENFAERFISIVKDKDSHWLEIASTAIHLNTKYREKSIVETMTIDVKAHKFGKKRIKEVMLEAEKLGLLIFD